MERTQIPVISGGSVIGDNGRGIPRVVGEIAAGDLTDRISVAWFEHEQGDGYQRSPSPQRIRNLKDELRKDAVSLPTAILLNLRDYQERIHLVGEDHSCNLALGQEPLYVVDGQHRVKALQELIHEDEDGEVASQSKWRNYQIPFVCLLGATQDEEMRQFYVVNSRAKSVPTDLAYTLLTKHAKSSEDARRQLLESSDAWKVSGQEIAERLAKVEPWLGRIRFPSQKKTKQMTIPSSGMVNSLRELVRGSSAVFEQAELDGRVQLLSAYWRGILRVLPDANDNPDHFTIQKMTGAVLMHSVFPNVLELARARYGNAGAVNPEAYQELMENPLLKLEGENRDGHVVRGADFWRSGAEGAAGAFSSNAGRRQLRTRILRELPPLRFD